ncbi:MAG TPA: hypothetical protein VNA69_13085 [Thermoanaerobaculia bacterium]|nr:hypothetical protein [Thermoanaerobaculia bacterium]
MRRFAALLALLVPAACGRPPVQDEVTIEFFGDSDAVVVTAETRFELHPRNVEARKRVDTAREAAQSNTDAWTFRFSRVVPEAELVTLKRNRGALESVTRSVRIPSNDLHRVFADVNVTIDILRGDGWRELAMYPGTSSRATREQQRFFEDELAAWSRELARYVTAVRRLYRYLDEHPQRAQFVFASIVNEKVDESIGPTEEEEPLLLAVVDAIEAIAKRVDAQETRSDTFAETADLMFNPFPARMTIRLPSDVLAKEGFAKPGKDLVIEPIDLMAAIGKLEGRWISPDPLALLLREEVPPAAELAKMPRRAELVSDWRDVAAAVREQLARPRAYVVRWRD